ncbi:hypothetical protein D1614_05130 [Maribellus luteus]|uniref:Uncharacterized protein n=1 Tax=Maribellus luteus TaxID=2305463 RepID=A0A399T7M1_9BACT|nr:hypothetical protein D1614_05130 [Maribellus luteus]
MNRLSADSRFFLWFFCEASSLFGTKIGSVHWPWAVSRKTSEVGVKRVRLFDPEYSGEFRTLSRQHVVFSCEADAA